MKTNMNHNIIIHDNARTMNGPFILHQERENRGPVEAILVAVEVFLVARSFFANRYPLAFVSTTAFCSLVAFLAKTSRAFAANGHPTRRGGFL